MAYDTAFVDPETKEHPKQPASGELKNVNPYQKYSRKIIRNVNVLVYDPFGYFVTDTIQKNINTIQKLGNHVHLKKRRFIMQNRILFKNNEPLNALKLSESERILREAVFINYAKIYTTETRNKDSVDVTGLVHDKWPVALSIALSDISAKADFRNQNLFGWGQQFQNSVGYYRSANTFEYGGCYNISNLENTFISYQATRDGTRADLVFDRPFYSPLAR